jgi:hypothetical protein
MTRILALAGLLLLGGCPDAAQTGDAAIPADGGAFTGCLDRPTELPRPPTGTLPCELIPPTLNLAAGNQ